MVVSKKSPGRKPVTDLSPRARRTRSALIVAAREIFSEKGYRFTRIVDITERAGAAVGSFYTHFDSKNEILYSALEQMVQDMYHERSAVPDSEDSPFEHLLLRNRQYFESYKNNSRLLAVFERVALDSADFRELRMRVRHDFVGRIARQIKRQQDAGICSTEIDAESTAGVLGSLVERSAYMAYVMGEQSPARDLPLLVTEVWANAIQLRRERIVSESASNTQVANIPRKNPKSKAKG